MNIEEEKNPILMGELDGPLKKIWQIVMIKNNLLKYWTKDQIMPHPQENNSLHNPKVTNSYWSANLIRMWCKRLFLCVH